MIYITGDIHKNIDIFKLNSKNFPEGKKLTKNDYLICTGDFGLILDVNESGDEEKYWIDWLTNKKWTTLFIDGNHENFDRLNDLPIIKKFNGNVGKVNDSIFHLKRGEIYEINNLKFFTFGGADSIDKLNRQFKITWWPEEIPSFKEIYYAYENLEKHNYNVDYILTHTAPRSIVDILFSHTLKYEFNDPVEIILEDFKKNISFNKWFFGHYHEDINFNDYICQYQNITKII